MSNVPVIYVSREIQLPDKGSWTNRFEIHSQSSNRVYTVAQEKNKRHWGCSCPGWITRRNCKHLTALGLPGFEQPKEIEVRAR